MMPHQVKNYVSLRRTFLFILTMFFSAGIPLSLSAEKVFLHLFSAEEPNPQLEHSLYLAAGVELMEAGFSSTRESENWDYLLQTDYATGGNQVSVYYRLYEAGTFRKKRAESNVQLNVDYDFDEEVAAAIRQLLELAGIEPDFSPEAEIEGLFSSSVEKTAPGFPDDPEYQADSNQQKETRSGADAEEYSSLLFDTSFSAAGIMFFGEVTEYFHYGAGGGLAAGLKWLHPDWSIFLGLKTSVFRVFNDSGVAGGPLYVSTTGTGLRFGRGWEAGIPFSFGLSGGAAFIAVMEAEEILAKTVPYGDLEIQATLPFGKRMNAGVGMTFLVVFEGDVLLVGASPTLTFGMEW